MMSESVSMMIPLSIVLSLMAMLSPGSGTGSSSSRGRVAARSARSRGGHLGLSRAHASHHRREGPDTYGAIMEPIRGYGNSARRSPAGWYNHVQSVADGGTHLPPAPDGSIMVSRAN